MWSLTLDEVWKSLAFGKNPWLVTSKALFVRANHSPADSSAESASGGGRGGPNRLNATRYCRSSAELVNRIFRKSAVSINWSLNYTEADPHLRLLERQKTQAELLLRRRTLMIDRIPPGRQPERRPNLQLRTGSAAGPVNQGLNDPERHCSVE